MNIQLVCLSMLLSTLTASWSLAQETSPGQEKKSDSPAATEKKAGAPKEEKSIPLLVQVVRLAPGETKSWRSSCLVAPSGQERATCATWNPSRKSSRKILPPRLFSTELLIFKSLRGSRCDGIRPV